MSLEQSYALLTQAEQAAELARMTEEMWSLMDRIAALTAKRGALMNAMMGRVTMVEVSHDWQENIQ